MAEEEEKIVVEEQPEVVEQPKEVTLEEGVDDLKQRLAAAEARAKAAEEAKHKAELEAHAARGTVQETNLQLVTNAIDTLRQSNEIAKANYKAAMSAGDYDAAAGYQEEMSSHAAKLLQLEQGKQALESAPAPVAPVQRPSDPVEAFAAQLSPRSADWVRRHPQFVTDPRLNQKMIAAHNMAMADGHVADSDEYFATVESLLQVKKAPPAEALSEASQPTARRTTTPPPAAPVSRDTRGGNVVRLSPEEREMAEMMKMTPEEYAKNKLALKKEGRLH
jgi:prepilin-type processing-associated H-X9-DG protein